MDFALTETHDQIRGTARGFLAERYPSGRIAEIADSSGTDTTSWTELVRQGWFDATLGTTELAVLAEESGRALHPTPWWSTLSFAVPTFTAAGIPLTGPAAFADGTGSCVARQSGSRWLLEGRVEAVVDASAATIVVIAVGTADGTALFTFDPGSAYATWSAGDDLDPLRPQADLALAGVPARPLATGPAARRMLTEARRRASVLLACEAVGVAGNVLQIATEYARQRHQFGRPIGTYQAISHRLAECYADLELARSLAYCAAAVLDSTAGAAQHEIDEAVACAQHLCPAAAVRACETAIQVHGATGVTWEFPLHRWYRRALGTELYLARQSDPLAVLATGLLGPI